MCECLVERRESNFSEYLYFFAVYFLDDSILSRG